MAKNWVHGIHTKQTENTWKWKWKCKLDQCAHENNTYPGIRKHISTKHKEHCIPPHHRQIECPFCFHKYANLEPMLLHLDIRENNDERKRRKPCTCPLKPNKLNHSQTWQHLLRVNQSERQTTILDIPNLDIQTDTDEETSEEDETPRQHIKKNKKTENRTSKQKQEQRQLETMRTMQQEKEEHLQTLENIHQILQQYDKTPDYIRREISESPDIPEKLEKYNTKRTMELLQQTQQVEQMVDLVWCCNIQKCYRIYKEQEQCSHTSQPCTPRIYHTGATTRHTHVHTVNKTTQQYI